MGTAHFMGLPQDKANTFTVVYAVVSSCVYYFHERLWSDKISQKETPRSETPST